MYPNSSQGLNKETDEAVYFFTPAFYPLDNFSAHKVKIWNKEFPTAEHAFQWKKFCESDPGLADKILEAGSPEKALNLAHANIDKQPKNWADIKVEVMKKILSAKVEQHEDVRQVLDKTSNRDIIENSPVDDFWGCGPKGDGKNMLGNIWMEIRNTIK